MGVYEMLFLFVKDCWQLVGTTSVPEVGWEMIHVIFIHFSGRMFRLNVVVFLNRAQVFQLG